MHVASRPGKEAWFDRAIAGHVSSEMLEHYSHIRIAAKREAVAALDTKPDKKQPAKKAEPEQLTFAS